MTLKKPHLSAEDSNVERQDSTPSAQDVIAQLERMLTGVSFKASPRRKEMLKFIVDEKLADRADRLKGVIVAQEVFGRDESFDQQSDPVVRLEARRLRSDLDSYYVDAGSKDPVRITIPIGGYVPYFEWQHQHAFASMATPEPCGQDITQPTAAPALTPSSVVNSRIAMSSGRLKRALAILTVGAFVAISAALGLSSPKSEIAAPRTAAIIVLPLETFGDSEYIELIAAGVTEDLIANLMLFQNFRVYSPDASFRQEANADPLALGRDLGVSFVVKGVMQSQNGQVHLRVRMFDAQTNEVRWSGSYSNPLNTSDFLASQRSLAVEISTALGEPYGIVNDAISLRMDHESLPSMQTYVCILQAYEYRRSFSDALFEPSLDCMMKAVERDPDYSNAWAMLGWLHLDAVRNDMVAINERSTQMAAAYNAANFAVELAPRNPAALAALSAITYYQGDYAAAEVLQREVLKLNPHDPDTLAQLGWRIAARGNREGLNYLEQAVTRSVNPPGWYFHLIAIYAYLDGDYSRALSALKTSVQDGSPIGLSFAAMSHAKLGDMEAARNALNAMADSWPLLGRDPAAVYRMQHVNETIVAALVDGLRAAGWAPP